MRAENCYLRPGQWSSSSPSEQSLTLSHRNFCEMHDPSLHWNSFCRQFDSLWVTVISAVFVVRPWMLLAVQWYRPLLPAEILSNCNKFPTAFAFLRKHEQKKVIPKLSEQRVKMLWTKLEIQKEYPGSGRLSSKCHSMLMGLSPLTSQCRRTTSPECTLNGAWGLNVISGGPAHDEFANNIEKIRINNQCFFDIFLFNGFVQELNEIQK